MIKIMAPQILSDEGFACPAVEIPVLISLKLNQIIDHLMLTGLEYLQPLCYANVIFSDCFDK